MYQTASHQAYTKPTNIVNSQMIQVSETNSVSRQHSLTGNTHRQRGCVENTITSIAFGKLRNLVWKRWGIH
jgi:hypothetical protein